MSHQHQYLQPESHKMNDSQGLFLAKVRDFSAHVFIAGETQNEPDGGICVQKLIFLLSEESSESISRKNLLDFTLLLQLKSSVI